MKNKSLIYSQKLLDKAIKLPIKLQEQRREVLQALLHK